MAKAISNAWEHISVWCENHDEPRQMKIMQNTEMVKTPFYMCGDGGDCANRMNLDDYQDAVLKFFSIMADKPFANLTNYRFTFKGHRHLYEVRVIKYTTDDIRLGIRNKSILGG